MSKTLLLRKRKAKSSLKFKYNFQLLKSKGAILVLIWDAIIKIHWHVMISSAIYLVHYNNNSFYEIFDNSLTAVLSLPLLFCPIGGLIADTWTGRYRTIITSVYVSFFAWIILIITYLFWKFAFQNGSVTISIIVMVTTFTFLIGFGGFQSVSVPYNIDQLMDSSSDEISALIIWHMFCYFAVRLISPIVLIYMQNQIEVLVVVCASGFLIICVILSHCIFKSHLNRLNEVSNPIRLIASVLMYAKRNKYPTNRSALTYWENDYPSRIDFGKERFGGPFTEEEVENVKTFGRIIPVLLLSMIVNRLEYDSVNLYQRSTNRNYWHVNFFELLIEQDYLPYLVAAILILIYQFILYPCFYKYIPTLLKRMGLGIFFSLLASATYMILTISDQYIEPISYCPLGINTLYNSTIILPSDYRWLILPEVMYGVSLFLLLTSSLEFIVAQTPKSMRGIMVGLWNAIIGISNLINGYSYLLYFYIGTESLGCLSYYYIGNTTFILIVFLIYLVVTRRYKVRIRDYIVPVYQIAEEHTTKYLDSSSEDSLDSEETVEFSHFVHNN